MTIAIDAEPANRKQRTGVEFVTFSIIKEFIRIDGGNLNRHYILFTKDDLLPDWPPLPENFTHKKLLWPSKYFWAHIRLGLALRSQKADINFIPANIIPFFTPKPIITEIHDIVFIQKPKYFTGKTIASHKFALKRAFDRANVLTTPTQTTADAIKGFFPNLQIPIKVIPLGINHEQFEPTAKAEDSGILQKFGLKNKNYFLFVGRLEAKKNIARLIESFEKIKNQHPDLQLALVGNPVDQIDCKSAKALGYQNTQITSILYRHALAFVFVSNYEGFGLPILEAQSSGCPVIASDIAVLRETGGQGAFYVDKDSVENITTGLQAIVKGSALRERLIKYGFENAKKFNWQTTAQKFLELFTSVAKK